MPSLTLDVRWLRTASIGASDGKYHPGEVVLRNPDRVEANLLGKDGLV